LPEFFPDSFPGPKAFCFAERQELIFKHFLDDRALGRNVRHIPPHTLDSFGRPTLSASIYIYLNNIFVSRHCPCLRAKLPSPFSGTLKGVLNCFPASPWPCSYASLLKTLGLTTCQDASPCNPMSLEPLSHGVQLPVSTWSHR